MTIVFWDGIIQNMKKIKVNLKSNSYFVYAGYPLEKIGEKLSDKKFGKKVLLLTDKNVSAIYGNKVVQSLKKLAKKEVLSHPIRKRYEFRMLATDRNGVNNRIKCCTQKEKHNHLCNISEQLNRIKRTNIQILTRPYHILISHIRLCFAIKFENDIVQEC